MTYDYRHIWLVAFPILLSMFFQQLIGMADVAFLGRVGQVELGASAIASLYYMMVFMLGVGFGVGVQIIIGKLNGAADHTQIGPVFYQALIVMMVFAVLGILLTIYGGPVFLKYIISSPAVLDATIEYLNYRVWGFVFAFAIIIFRNFYVGITDTGVLIISSIVMTVVNLMLNYVLIFGKLGMPMMGIGGAALASVIAEFASVLCFLLYTKFNVDIYKYGLNVFKKLDFSLIAEIFRVSIWTTMQIFISFATWFFFFIAIEHLGEAELAASNVLRQVSSMVFIIVQSLAITVNSLTSNLIGQHKSSEIYATYHRALRLSYILCMVCCALFALMPETMMLIFTSDRELIVSAKGAYYVMLGSYVLAVPTLILFNVLLGTGATKHGMYLEFVALLLYVVYLWYVVLVLKSPLPWCWSGEYVYNISLWFLSYLYLKKRYYFVDSEAK